MSTEFRSDVAAASLSTAVQEAMLSSMPTLRAFAISLCGSADRADDLVQETLMRAIANIESFEPGTNLRGWLSAILRNIYFSECRKTRNEVEDVDGRCVAALKTVPDQDSRIELDEFRAALATLPNNQQEALLLVGALGFCHEEAAAICGTGAATIRSRIHRARARLTALLDLGSADEFGPDNRTRAVLNAMREGASRLTAPA
jgi:RNA polymerase sigma-70 factor, ECF subfamily